MEITKYSKNCKTHLELNWTIDCVMCCRDTKISIKNPKRFVQIFTFSTKDNAKLTKQLSDEFKRPTYWNKNNSHDLTQNAENNVPIKIEFDSTFKELKDYLFLLLLMLMVMLIKLKEIIISKSGKNQIQCFNWW